MALSLSGGDPRGPRRGVKGSCGTPGTPRLELAALIRTLRYQFAINPRWCATEAWVLHFLRFQT